MCREIPRMYTATDNFQDYLRATTSASVYKIRVTEGDGESEIDPNSLICIGTPQSSEYLKYYLKN